MSFESYQDAYNKTRDKLEAQGLPALSDNFSCVYNTSDGRRCAVGCHLSFQVKGEHNFGTVRGLVTERPELLSPGGDLHIKGVTKSQSLEFWAAIQRLHDNYDFDSTGLKVDSFGLHLTGTFFTEAQHDEAARLQEVSNA